MKPNFVIKEQQFLSYVKYNDIFKESNITDKIVIQGIADLLVGNSKGCILIDYKTNIVKKPDQLVEKYRLQLKIYKDCLEKAMHIKICNTYIYSFCLNKFIEIV